MTDPVALLLLLFAIYLSECIERIPDGAVLVLPRSGGPVRPSSLVARITPGLRVGLLNPVPGVASATPLAGGPVALSPSGVCPLSGDGRPPWVFVFDAGVAAAASRADLILGDRRVPVGSSRMARRLAALVEELQQAKIDRRGGIIEEALRHDSSPALLRRAFARSWSRTKWLRVFSGALFLYVFAVAPAVIATRGITHTWPTLLGALLYLLAFTLFEFWRAHGALLPGLRLERRAALVKMAVAPTAAMRAVDGIQRDLLGGFHPVAALAVPGNEAEVLRFLRERLAAAPAPVSSPGLEATGEGIRDWFWKTESDVLESLAESAGVRRREIFSAPAPSSPSARSYCPRCRQQYVRIEGKCTDCPDATLTPLVTEPRPAGTRTG